MPHNGPHSDDVLRRQADKDLPWPFIPHVGPHSDDVLDLPWPFILHIDPHSDDALHLPWPFIPYVGPHSDDALHLPWPFIPHIRPHSDDVLHGQADHTEEESPVVNAHEHRGSPHGHCGVSPEQGAGKDGLVVRHVVPGQGGRRT